MRPLSFVVWFFLAQLVLAGPPEAEMRAALSQRLDNDVLRIYNAWLNSKTSADIELARKYLGVVRGSSTREKMLIAIEAKGITALYPAALQAWQAEFPPSNKNRAKLVESIARLIPSDRKLADAIRSSMVHEDVLVLSANPEGQILARALFAANALSGVTSVSYSVGTRTLPLTPNSIDVSKLPQIVASMAAQPLIEKGLVDWLMQVRATLNHQTAPTREAFTSEIIKIIENSENPGISNEFAMAARNSMVKDKADRYTPSKGGESPKRRHLIINKNDSADLLLARTLTRQPIQYSPRENPNGAKVQGLDDVEIIEWRGPPERVYEVIKGDRRIKDGWDRVNFPDMNEVRNHDGDRISDLLDSKNFGPALVAYHDDPAPPTAIARRPALLQKAIFSNPELPRGSVVGVDCRFEPFAKTPPVAK